MVDTRKLTSIFVSNRKQDLQLQVFQQNGHFSAILASSFMWGYLLIAIKQVFQASCKINPAQNYNIESYLLNHYPRINETIHRHQQELMLKSYTSVLILSKTIQSFAELNHPEEPLKL